MVCSTCGHFATRVPRKLLGECSCIKWPGAPLTRGGQVTLSRIRRGFHPSQRCHDRLLAVVPWQAEQKSVPWGALVTKEHAGKPQSVLQSLVQSFAEERAAALS